MKFGCKRKDFQSPISLQSTFSKFFLKGVIPPITFCLTIPKETDILKLPVKISLLQRERRNHWNAGRLRIKRCSETFCDLSVHPKTEFELHM